MEFLLPLCSADEALTAAGGCLEAADERPMCGGKGCCVQRLRRLVVAEEKECDSFQYNYVWI